MFPLAYILQFLMFPSLRFQRNRNTFSRFRQISVSGITYFRNRYHVNKLRKREITFGNKFVSFLLSAETWSYGPATCLFFFLFPSVSVALTT